MRVFLFFGLLSILLSPPAFAKSRLIVGGDHDNPPYEYLENGKPAGFNVEVMQAVAEILEFDLEIRLGPWKKVRHDVEEGKLDALTGMYYSLSRKAKVDFTVPHTIVSPAVFVRNDSPIRSFDDIREKEILVQDGDIIHDYLKKEGIASRIITVTDPAEEIKLLAAGNYDCAFMPSRLQGEFFLKKYNITGVRIITTPLPSLRYSFAVSKLKPELRYKLDEALNSLRESGKYREIYEKWFGVYERKYWWETVKYYVFALTIIAACLLLVFLWSWSLRRQVSIRTKELVHQKRKLKNAHDELEQRVEERTAELQKANQELTASRQMLGNILENFPGVVFWKNRNSVYLGCNKNFALAAGLRDPYEIVGKTDFDLPWAETEAKQYVMADRLVIQSACPKLNIIETQLQADGGTVWFDTNKIPLFDASRNVIGVLGTSSDITERKKAEDALRESEEKYRSLVNNLNVAVFRTTIGPPGRILQANPMMSRLTGYTHEELKNLSILDSYQDPSQRKMLLAELQAKGFVQNREVVVKKKDGTPVWASLSLTVQRDERGQVLWIDGVGEDITERRHAEQALARVRAELERSNKDLEQFALTVAHDLKAPLTTIGGFAALLQQKKTTFDEQASRALSHITQGVDRMGQLINNLLAYAMVASGSGSSNRISCASVVETALSNLAKDIETHGAVVTMDTLPEITGDETQYVELFQNLIGNAIKYRGEAAPRIHISVEALTPEKEKNRRIKHITGWLFSVSDNGIGIDPESYDRIFEIFHSLKQKRDVSSTGIGLALCKKIVERHGGNIWVESEPGKGSTFYFTVPVSLR